MTELIGLNSQLGQVDSRYLGSLEAPALLMLEGSPVMVFAIQAKQVVLGHPRRGLQRIPLTDLQQSLGEQVRFVSPVASRRQSPGSERLYSIKYRRALVLVFAASLLAQLFGLAIPLLIQQIIDKVSSARAISACLNVLHVDGGAGNLPFVMPQRTYIFVDTTDRMDLTLVGVR